MMAMETTAYPSWLLGPTLGLLTYLQRMLLSLSLWLRLLLSLSCSCSPTRSPRPHLISPPLPLSLLLPALVRLSPHAPPALHHLLCLPASRALYLARARSLSLFLSRALSISLWPLRDPLLSQTGKSQLSTPKKIPLHPFTVDNSFSLFPFAFWPSRALFFFFGFRRPLKNPPHHHRTL
jgi:hypothetical protein